MTIQLADLASLVPVISIKRGGITFPAHVHQLQREPGRITCACGLDVAQPAGMPDYRSATMAAWALRSRP